ncbi:MAG TPA: TonB-dependent receptor, partial [Gemmatimonadaceae bacterium]|nr:TonB-dependent receptor [Gemmatimonadaceae bacterium]
ARGTCGSAGGQRGRFHHSLIIRHAVNSSEGWLRRRCLMAAALIACTHPVLAQGQTCSASADPGAAAAHARWSPPLDRRISLRPTTISLRDALDQIAERAHIRLSYSADLLPLDQDVCLGAHRAALGDVLVALLRGTRTAPIAVASDLIAIAPAPSNVPESKADPVPPVNMLDRVLVTGNSVETPAHELALGVDVIDGRRLARDNTSSLGEALNDYAPGTWSWPQSPASMINAFAGMRGASSFGVSSPKIYVDGIEVANPLLVSRFSPDAIDRIEVIRGPEGSALYGTDALSGVVNLVTRYENADDARARVSVQSSGGLTQSSFARDAFSQAHEIALYGGSNTRSASLRVSAGSVGDFIPEGHSRQMLANATGRIVGARATISGSARFFTQIAGTPASPLLAGSPASVDPDEMGSQSADAQQSVREYTFASNAVVNGDRWTHSFVAGVDGYRLANIESNFAPIPSSADSALRAAQGGADRATLRASSSTQLAPNAFTHARLTFAAEHTTLRASTLATNARMLESARGDDMVESWQNTTGLSGQLDLDAAGALYLSGGLRLERDSRLQTAPHLAALPMLGAAVVEAAGPLTIKLRTAYGRGLRAPTLLARSTEYRNRPRTDALGAEMQSGVESGIDVSMHRAFSVRVTRFDQRASGLIQQVAVATDTQLVAHHTLWSLQNVGEITNRGWEFEGSSAFSRLELTGGVSLVDSRVRRLASGYTGDLETGDRMLQVPARTMSVTATWNADHWFASLGGSRAFDWINYDEVAYARDYLGAERPAHGLLGASLRRYWRQYDGGLRLRANLSRDLGNNMSLEISGDNLLGYQLDEPDNATVLPGRTLMTGIRVKF